MSVDGLHKWRSQMTSEVTTCERLTMPTIVAYVSGQFDADGSFQSLIRTVDKHLRCITAFIYVNQGTSCKEG